MYIKQSKAAINKIISRNIVNIGRELLGAYRHFENIKASINMRVFKAFCLVALSRNMLLEIFSASSMK